MKARMDPPRGQSQPLNPAYALAIETSASIGGVAVGRGDQVLASQSFPSAKRHAVDLLPAIELLCRNLEIEPRFIGIIFVSIGPGSFTGLRIGLTAARMLAWTFGARVVAVGSLEAIAQNSLHADPVPSRVAVLVDAKRNHVYASSFTLADSSYVEIQPPAEVEPAEFLAAQGADCAVLGEGLALHRLTAERLGLRVLSDELHPPRPEAVYLVGSIRAKAGKFDDARCLVPHYIRLPEPEEKWASQRLRTPK